MRYVNSRAALQYAINVETYERDRWSKIAQGAPLSSQAESNALDQSLTHQRIINDLNRGIAMLTVAARREE